MTSTFQNLIINTLPDLLLNSGGYNELNFYIYNSANTPIDIRSASCSWQLWTYSTPHVMALEKSGSVTVSGSITNRFTVTLNTEDTGSLTGKFFQIPKVISVPNFEYKNNQGIVTVIP